MRVEVEIDDKLYQAIMEKEVKIGFASSFTDIFVDAIHKGKECKTGRWVKHDTGHSTYYDCSLCSCLANCTETADTFIWKLSKFCPDCGAKMEGEEVE